MNNIWFCGIPGSRLSAISNHIAGLPGIDNSDRTAETSFGHATAQGKDDSSGHEGVYWGQTPKTTHWNVLSDEHPSFLQGDINSMFSGTGTRILKSHIWARHNNLDYINKNFKGDMIFLVYREPEKSYRWWNAVMKFEDGYYPDYRLIYNEDNFMNELKSETCEMMDFAVRHGIQWKKYNTENFNKTFNADVTIDNRFSDIYYIAHECTGE